MDVDNLKKNFAEHWDKATAIRMLSIDAVQKAKSGHPGMPMGMADVCTVLFGNYLKFDPKHPDWPDREGRARLGDRRPDLYVDLH